MNAIIDFNEKLESHPFYIFIQRHKKVIMIFEGVFIICLLVYLNSYVYKDHIIKKQIAENCNWEDERFFCMCEQREAYDLRYGTDADINLSKYTGGVGGGIRK